MENINHDVPPLPPPRKYVSIFRIDGEPILPPLMTVEKRKQMQQLKDKALQIEKRIRERKHHVHYACAVNNEDIGSETSRSSHCSNAGENVSHRSHESYESKLKDSEQSMILLKNLIKRQQESVLDSPKQSYANIENLEKINKLQKSEILIYDNSTKEVIQVPPGEKNKSPIFDEHSRSVLVKKPSNLLLAGVDSKGLTAIPSICLNPPTPVTVNKHITDSLVKADSNESLVISENPDTMPIAENSSSDESLNSMRTQSDKKSSKNLQQTFTETIEKHQDYGKVNERSITPSKNVIAKIQQFESISSDSATPQSSPEKFVKPRKTCLGTFSSDSSRSIASLSYSMGQRMHEQMQQLNQNNASSSVPANLSNRRLQN